MRDDDWCGEGDGKATTANGVQHALLRSAHLEDGGRQAGGGGERSLGSLGISQRLRRDAHTEDEGPQGVAAGGQAAAGGWQALAAAGDGDEDGRPGQGKLQSQGSPRYLRRAGRRGVGGESK